LTELEPLDEIEQDPRSPKQLLPLVYRELRSLAAQRLAQEKPGQTLEATALVHEAYIRLVEGADPTLRKTHTPPASSPGRRFRLHS
jgi:hypothetical protein